MASSDGVPRAVKFATAGVGGVFGRVIPFGRPALRAGRVGLQRGRRLAAGLRDVPRTRGERHAVRGGREEPRCGREEQAPHHQSNLPPRSAWPRTWPSLSAADTVHFSIR